jgi:hypothetical protein
MLAAMVKKKKAANVSGPNVAVFSSAKHIVISTRNAMNFLGIKVGGVFKGAVESIKHF